MDEEGRNRRAGRIGIDSDKRPRLALDAAERVPQAQDHWRVDLSEAWEITFWSREFRCSDSDLRKAVEAVGNNAGAVRAYLASQNQQQRR